MDNIENIDDTIQKVNNLLLNLNQSCETSDKQKQLFNQLLSLNQQNEFNLLFDNKIIIKIYQSIQKYHQILTIVSSGWTLLERISLEYKSAIQDLINLNIIQFISNKMNDFNRKVDIQAIGCSLLTVLASQSSEDFSLIIKNSGIIQTIQQAFELHSNNSNFINRGCKAIISICQMNEVLLPELCIEASGGIQYFVNLFRKFIFKEETSTSSCSICSVLLCLASKSTKLATELRDLHILDEISLVIAKYPDHKEIAQFAPSAVQKIAQAVINIRLPKKRLKKQYEIVQKTAVDILHTLDETISPLKSFESSSSFLSSDYHQLKDFSIQIPRCRYFEKKANLRPFPALSFVNGKLGKDYLSTKELEKLKLERKDLMKKILINETNKIEKKRYHKQKIKKEQIPFYADILPIQSLLIELEEQEIKERKKKEEEELKEIEEKEKKKILKEKVQKINTYKGKNVNCNSNKLCIEQLVKHNSPYTQIQRKISTPKKSNYYTDMLKTSNFTSRSRSVNSSPLPFQGFSINETRSSTSPSIQLSSIIIPIQEEKEIHTSNSNSLIESTLEINQSSSVQSTSKTLRVSQSQSSNLRMNQSQSRNSRIHKSPSKTLRTSQSTSSLIQCHELQNESLNEYANDLFKRSSKSSFADKLHQLIEKTEKIIENEKLKVQEDKEENKDKEEQEEQEENKEKEEIMIKEIIESLTSQICNKLENTKSNDEYHNNERNDVNQENIIKNKKSKKHHIDMKYINEREEKSKEHEQVRIVEQVMTQMLEEMIKQK